MLPGQPAAAVPVPLPVVAPAQTGTGALDYREPVDAAVADGWRPPSTPYGAGNRGWQYATTEGDTVRAAGAGTVTFAGQVGGVLAVTITHRGGLRTSYTRLSAIEVLHGDALAIGDRLGTAMVDLHFGVRLGERYIDPGLLFTPGALRHVARLRPL